MAPCKLRKEEKKPRGVSGERFLGRVRVPRRFCAAVYRERNGLLEKGRAEHCFVLAHDAEKRTQSLRGRAARSIPIRERGTPRRASSEPRRRSRSASGGGRFSPVRGRGCLRGNPQSLTQSGRSDPGRPGLEATGKIQENVFFSRVAKRRNSRKRGFSSPIPSVAQMGVFRATLGGKVCFGEKDGTR